MSTRYRNFFTNSPLELVGTRLLSRMRSINTDHLASPAETIGIRSHQPTIPTFRSPIDQN